MTATWDERLITRGRAADICGTWPLTIDGSYLRCAQDGGNVMQLPPAGRQIDVDRLIAAVVGHMVKCHNYSLSGGEQRGTDG